MMLEKLEDYKYLLAFIFVIIVAILASCGHLTLFALSLSLFVNFLALGRYVKDHKGLGGLGSDDCPPGCPAPSDQDNIIAEASSALVDPGILKPVTVQPAVSASIYGTQHDLYESCKLAPSLQKWSSTIGPVYNVDAAIANLSVQRNREKRAMDGALVKDEKYYAYHFDDELAKEENKPWWGREEY